MIVIKVGGRTAQKGFDYIIEDLTKINEKVILVHGGGDQVTSLSQKLGVTPQFVQSPQGIKSRYTSREELEIFIMAMSLINKNFVTALNYKGRKTVGLTGVDGGILKAERKKKIVILDERGKKRIIEGGYTGKVKAVDVDMMKKIMEIYDIAVFAPIAFDDEGGVPLNIDGDQAAFSISSFMKADALILLTDVDGVILEGKVVDKIPSNEAKAYAEKIGPGMNRKVLMASEAILSGVKRVIISSGIRERPIARAISGEGTVIV